MQILTLCTANQCRSPMAEVLLQRALDERGVPATVASAGSMRGGVPVSDGSVRAMARRGLVLDGRRSRTVTADEVAAADLVLCMERSHVRSAVVVHPPAWPRTFTLKELVRRGEALGPRGAAEPLDRWLERLGHGRDRRALLAADPIDDVADPMGRPDSAYEATAALLDDLVERAVDLAFPASAAASS